MLALAARHPVASVFVLALVVRALLAVAVTVLFGAGLFFDDATYSLLAAERASGRTGRWDEYNYYLYDSTATFMVPLTVLYRLLGPEPLVGRLLVAVFGSAAAAATTRLAMEAVETRWALLAGAFVALLPSQVLFSSVILKDALVWAVLALVGVAVARLGRAQRWGIAATLAFAAVLLLLLSRLRLHSFVVACWAVALASFAGARRGRGMRISGAVGLLVLLPLVAGVGPAGLHHVLEQRGTLAEKRQANAQGAETALVEPTKEQTPPAPPRSPVTPGEEPQPAPDADSADDLEGLGTGLRALLLDPLPWRATRNDRVELARLEALVAWWPLLALALLGLYESRRYLRVMAYPLLTGGAVALMYALAEGNFGTAYRHRGELVWAVALLAALGARSAVRRVRGAVPEGRPPARGGAAPLPGIEAGASDPSGEASRAGGTGTLSRRPSP